MCWSAVGSTTHCRVNGDVCVVVASSFFVHGDFRHLGTLDMGIDEVGFGEAPTNVDFDGRYCRADNQSAIRHSRPNHVLPLN